MNGVIIETKRAGGVLNPIDAVPLFFRQPPLCGGAKEKKKKKKEKKLNRVSSPLKEAMFKQKWLLGQE